MASTSELFQKRTPEQQQRACDLRASVKDMTNMLSCLDSMYQKNDFDSSASYGNSMS
ncbi:MAG: hypothetical protein P1U40_10735 [Coxiellaceae bacterium]|nr:hypothetical protein [Coxiellaceae bacterium]